jgi:hypothetical protein
VRGAPWHEVPWWASSGDGKLQGGHGFSDFDGQHGELRAKALYRPWSRPAMSASLDVASLDEGIVEELDTSKTYLFSRTLLLLFCL